MKKRKGEEIKMLYIYIRQRHGQQYGDSQRERGMGGLGEVKVSKGGTNGDGKRLDFGW